MTSDGTEMVSLLLHNQRYFTTETTKYKGEYTKCCMVYLNKDQKFITACLP